MDYITQKGDTFDIIAYQAYGNEEMVKPIIEANPQYTETIVFDFGTKLTIPDIDTSTENSALPPWRK